LAGRHAVLPARHTAARARKDVVERQVLAPWHRATILARVAVAEKDTAARAWDRAVAALDADVAHQADDQRYIERCVLGAQALLGGLDQLGLLLEQQNDRALHWNHPQRLVAGVQNQHVSHRTHPLSNAGCVALSSQRGQIWTGDLQRPVLARYQAALHAVENRAEVWRGLATLD